MKSRWFEHKETAIALRKTGVSMIVIEDKLGIPRSTLSGWFKDIQLTTAQKQSLEQNSAAGRIQGRKSALKWHHEQKALRLLQAKEEAISTLGQIELTPATLDIAFAMLYLGEGAKNNVTSIANSDPVVLKFVLKVLELNYGITKEMVRCELHLRADQDPMELKSYWSQELGIPLTRFRGAYIDMRSAGKQTYEKYKGVCVLYCGSIAIQRKLIYLYTLFCEKIAELGEGD